MSALHGALNVEHLPDTALHVLAKSRWSLPT